MSRRRDKPCGGTCPPYGCWSTNCVVDQPQDEPEAEIVDETYEPTVQDLQDLADRLSTDDGWEERIFDAAIAAAEAEIPQSDEPVDEEVWV